MGISLTCLMSTMNFYYLNFSLLSSFVAGKLTVLLGRDLNRLIMDYLVIEGYKSAAEEFSQEANLTPPVDFESIESRMNIREALQRGDVEDAITRVNDLNPEVSFFLCQVPLDGDHRIKPFMHHSQTFGSVRRLNQNFSLQYEHFCFLYTCV